MSRIILRAQDTRKLLGIKVIADANLDAQQMSNLAQLISDQKPGPLSWSKGQKTRALYLVREGRVHINRIRRTILWTVVFGHEMLVAECGVNTPQILFARHWIVCVS
jgi:hypothetical protein